MSLRRQRSAPMLNVEATGSMLIDPIGAGSARPPTSTVTAPYYPPKTSKNRNVVYGWGNKTGGKNLEHDYPFWVRGFWGSYYG